MSETVQKQLSIAGFINYLLETGLPEQQIVEAMETDLDSLDSLPRPAMYYIDRLMKRANTHFDIDWIGLVLGRKLGVEAFGPAELSLARATDLRTYFENVKTYRNAGPNSFIPDMLEQGEFARLRAINFSPAGYSKKNVNELLYSRFYTAITAVFEHQPIESIWFEFSEPENTAIYSEYFSCPVYFNQPESCLFVKQSVLDQPLKNKVVSEPEYLAELYSNLKQGARKIRHLASDVHRALEASDMNLVTDADGVAKVLGVSKRTLNRILHDLGTTFRDIKKDVVLAKAKKLLKDSDMTLIEIAEQLGYSDSAAFSRAFKLEAGLSPGEYRKIHR